MTDITTRLLSMSEAMYMDRDQEELDALLLEAKGEIERLREALKPLVPIASAILAEAPDTASNFSMFVDCEGIAHRIKLDDLRAIVSLIPQQKGNVDAKQ